MPSRFNLLAGCVLWAGLAGSAPAAEALRTGIEPHAEPLSYVDANGNPTGFAIELAKAIARDQQLELQFVVKPWNEILEDFRAGQLDLLPNVAYTAERDMFIDYSVAHVEMKAGVFVHKHGVPVRSLDELRTLRVGTSYRSLSYDYATSRGWMAQAVNYGTLHHALAGLNRGECDVVIATRLIGLQIARDEGLQNVTVSELELPDLSYQLHLGVPAGDSDLLYKINAGLAHLRASGAYDRLYEKWIGPLEPRRLRLKDVQPFLAPLIVVLLAIAVTFAWQRRLLRRLARSAAAMRESEERLTQVIEGSRDGFWDWNLETGRIARSERWASMLGYTLAEIEPQIESGTQLVHPDDLAIYRSVQKDLYAGRMDRFDVEYRMKAKSGEWRWIQDRGKVVARNSDGAPLRMAGTHTDITERKRTESALRESQAMLKRSAQFLQQTQAAARIGGWEVDVRTQRVYWTEETYRIHETTLAGFEPTLESALAFYPPESRSILANAINACMANGTPFNLELDLVTAKKQCLDVNVLGRAEIESGRVTKIYGSFRDITEQRLASQEHEKLQHKMQEAQKLESLGVLAGGIAHDFNNLLTVILANASLAREDTEPADHADRLNHIETAAHRAADLCRQMLAYAGKGTFVTERLDLTALVHDTAQLLLVSLNKKAHLELLLDPGLPPVLADASQLRQVVMNLVINASEALGDAPGTIRLMTRLARPERTPGMVSHSFEVPSGDCVCLEVTDTGSGMSPTTLGRIFDPFFSTKFAGRGLGLAAVLGIVRAHRGELTVRSTPGQGSTFRLYLPVAERLVTEPPSLPAAPVSTTGGKLLVADDEQIVLMTTAAVLRHQGYHVVLAKDGREAVQAFRAAPHDFAAVLLDLMMPGLDGTEALREIRAINPAARVLLMSGYSEADIGERLDGYGPVAILRKPFTQQMLAASVADVIATGSTTVPPGV